MVTKSLFFEEKNRNFHDAPIGLPVIVCIHWLWLLLCSSWMNEWTAINESASIEWKIVLCNLDVKVFRYSICKLIESMYRYTRALLTRLHWPIAMSIILLYKLMIFIDHIFMYTSSYIYVNVNVNVQSLNITFGFDLMMIVGEWKSESKFKIGM